MKIFSGNVHLTLSFSICEKITLSFRICPSGNIKKYEVKGGNALENLLLPEIEKGTYSGETLTQSISVC